jgi:hypothetical protein
MPLVFEAVLDDSYVDLFWSSEQENERMGEGKGKLVWGATQAAQRRGEESTKFMGELL